MAPYNDTTSIRGGLVSYSVGFVTEGSRVRDSGAAMLLYGSMCCMLPCALRYVLMMMMMMMMIGVLRPLLCAWKGKWAERPAKVMRRSERRNNDMWSSTLLLDHRGAL